MSRKKQVDITDDMIAQIERVTGTSVSADDIVVFEAAALSTKPLHKPGSFYHAARPSRTMLEEMAASVNDGSESVPLHTLHMQGREIPKGRVFQARVSDEIDGSATLRAMFYLPLSERDLVEKINLSILDEVSVGVKSKQALCSKCGFDYFGADADFTHLWSQTCDKDHTIGEGDVHLKLVGLDKWMELSLVSRGASSKPKILSRASQLVSKDEYDRMAADGRPLEALVLFTSTEMETPMTTETTPVEPTPAPETPAAAPAAEEFDARAAIEALTAEVAELKALTASEPDPVVETLDVETLQAELATAQARIQELEAAAAAPQETAPAPETVTLTVPAGGVSASAISDAKRMGDKHLQANAFKTKR